jgi:hypothetical protein
LRIWSRDSDYGPELLTDIKRKFDAMFKKAPDFYPLDEVEKDVKRKETVIFTASCKEETGAERLRTGFASLKL